MAITLPELPFAKDALQPYMSKETLDYHHDKHHKKYVTTLNELIKGTEYENAELEDIVQGSFGKKDQKAIFNNSGQTWNHNFFWKCLSAKGDKNPDTLVKTMIDKNFTSVDTFKKQFTDAAVKQFGSGWAWLVLGEDGKLTIESTSNAETPVAEGRHPLLTCDVWEHAYYIDYRNERPKFVEAFWNLVNWDFVGQQLELSSQAAAAFKGRTNHISQSGVKGTV